MLSTVNSVSLLTMLYIFHVEVQGRHEDPNSLRTFVVQQLCNLKKTPIVSSKL